MPQPTRPGLGVHAGRAEALLSRARKDAAADDLLISVDQLRGHIATRRGPVGEAQQILLTAATPPPPIPTHTRSGARSATDVRPTCATWSTTSAGHRLPSGSPRMCQGRPSSTTGRPVSHIAWPGGSPLQPAVGNPTVAARMRYTRTHVRQESGRSLRFRSWRHRAKEQQRLRRGDQWQVRQLERHSTRPSGTRSSYRPSVDDGMLVRPAATGVLSYWRRLKRLLRSQVKRNTRATNMIPPIPSTQRMAACVPTNESTSKKRRANRAMRTPIHAVPPRIPMP